MAKSIKKGGHLFGNRKRRKYKHGGSVRKTIRSSLKGGKKKRKIRCWTKMNKNNKKYVVCTGSRGQKKPRRSKRLRNKQKGGFSFSDIKTKISEYFKPTTTHDIGDEGNTAIQQAALDSTPNEHQGGTVNPQQANSGVLLTGGYEHIKNNNFTQQQ